MFKDFNDFSWNQGFCIFCIFFYFNVFEGNFMFLVLVDGNSTFMKIYNKLEMY